MEKKYSLGFIFTPSLDRVLLVHKLRPEWQEGKVNGIGGKREEGEDSADCMVRETTEESGLITQKEDWVLLGEIQQPAGNVDVYALMYKGDLKDAKSAGDEKIEWFGVSQLPENIMSNLIWLVPFAIDKLKDKVGLNTFSVEYL
tara:strand:+ start:181 stop:612 length:432 start_codon:yes stop_codon:yes gene_type:complete